MKPTKIQKKPTSSKIIWLAALLISAIYILNPTMGIIEVLPDNLPLVGNLDEAGATVLFMKAWAALKG